MSTTNENTASDVAIGRLFEELRLAALADNALNAMRSSADGVLDKYVTIEAGEKTVVAVLADQETVDSTFASAEVGANYTTTYSGPAFSHRDMYQATFTAFHHIALDALGRTRTYADGVRDADVRDIGVTAPETEDVLEDLAFDEMNGRMDLHPCVLENGLVTRMDVPEAEANSFALFAGRNDGSPVLLNTFLNREAANAYLHSLDAHSRDGDGNGYVIPRLEREITNGLPKRDRSYLRTRLDRLRSAGSSDELRRIFEEAEKGAREITPHWERVSVFQRGLHTEEERMKVRRLLGDYLEIAAQSNRRLVEMELDEIKEMRHAVESAGERELSRHELHTEHFEQALAHFDDERLWQPNQITEIGDFYQFQAEDLTLFAPYGTRESVEDNSPARPAPGDRYTITRNNLAFDRERNKYSVTSIEHYTIDRNYYGELHPRFFRAEIAGVVPLNEKVLTREQIEDLRRVALSKQENTMSTQTGTTSPQEGRKKYFTDDVANRFAAELEKGESPMQRYGVPVFPYNPATGRAFHGINALSLMLQNRADDRWLAWDEAKMAGLRIKNNEKPTPVQKWLPKREGEDKPRAITTWYYNGEQLLGMPPMPHKPERPDPMERVLDFLKHSGAELVYDREHRGYYSKRDDTIHLANPEKVRRDQFCEDALNHYFKSLGHPSRLDRSETFNTAGYGREAQEELICGFATMTMCAELGIPIQPDRYTNLAEIWQSQMVARPLDFARDIRAADDMVKITLEREHDRNVKLNRNTSELWRSTPVEFPHGAVRTFLDRKEALDAIKNFPEALDKFMLDEKEVFALKETGYILEKKALESEIPDSEYSLLIKTQGFDRDGNTHDVLLSYDIQLDDKGTIEHKTEPKVHSIREMDRGMSLPRDWNGHLELQGFRTNDNGEPEPTDEPEFYTIMAKRENGELEPVANFDQQQDAIKYRHQVTRQFEYQGKQRGIDFDYDLLKNPDREFKATRQEADRPLGEKAAEREQGSEEAEKRPAPALEPTEETRAECIVAMEAVGMHVTDKHPIFDGQGHRIDVEGDKPRQGSGWYIAFSNNRPAGVCVNNRSQERVEWSKSRGYKLTENKKRELNGIAQAKKTTYQKERDAKQEQALAKLHGMIEKTFVKPTEPTPYLQSKMLPMDPGIYQNKGSTCVPIHDLEGNIQSMAYIQANGTKRYAKDCDKNGNMYVFGGVEELGKAKAFVVGEGYSTVASAYHATLDMEVANVAGFDSANTQTVIETLCERYPGVPIIELADDDKHLELRDPPLPNQGRLNAEETAKKFDNVTAVFPVWPEGTPVDRDHTDFDDLRRMNTPDMENTQEGFAAVRSQLQPVIEMVIEQTQENKQAHEHEKTRGSLARN